MTTEELKSRTKKFAHRCVKAATEIQDSILGKHVARQIIRCSTSVAANYRAVCLSQSEKAFVSKLSIVIEEIDETHFWLEFLIDENLITESRLTDLVKESKELTSIFIASRISLRKKMKISKNSD